MPLPIIPANPFPDVPLLPGVPQLVRSLLFPPTPLPAISATSSSALWAASQALPKWGVFDSDGNQVLTPDNVLNFDVRKEWKLPDFPVQDGSFATYNKVIIPFETSLRFTKGGSQSDRAAFLNEIENIAPDLNLYTVITPERSYVDVNILRFEVSRRGSEGAYYLTEVDVFFRQINQVQAQYSSTNATAADTSNAQNAAALPPVNQGNVQSQAAPTTAATAAANAIASAPN